MSAIKLSIMNCFRSGVFLPMKKLKDFGNLAHARDIDLNQANTRRQRTGQILWG